MEWWHWILLVDWVLGAILTHRWLFQRLISKPNPWNLKEVLEMWRFDSGIWILTIFWFVFVLDFMTWSTPPERKRNG